MPDQPDPDAVLMLRVKRGDRAAFAELVEKYKQPVMNFIYRTLRDETEAEDLAQNVFLQVYKSRSRYRADGEIFHVAFHHRAQSVPERNPPPLAPSRRIPRGNPHRKRRPAATAIRGQTQMAPPEKLLHGELAQKIEEALAELPENQRTAILLCRQDELSYEEIAGVLDCSLSATKSLIHRGRETLKEKLKRYLQHRRVERVKFKPVKISRQNRMVKWL